MKKLVVFIFLASIMFFVGTINVEAGQGSISSKHYAYDINEFTIGDTNIIIDGWAAIDDNSGKEMHNIDPNYTLKLVAEDPSGSKIYTSKIYQNTNPEQKNVGGNSISGIATPKDFTVAYFTNQGTYSSYPAGNPTSLRGEYVKNTTGNFFYINIDFKFVILTADVVAMLDEIENNGHNLDNIKIYFDLTVSQKAAPNLTIFGTTSSSKFYTVTASKTIRLGVQSVNFANNLSAASLAKKGWNFKIQDTLTKLTNIAVSGYLQSKNEDFLSHPLRYVLCDAGTANERVVNYNACTSGNRTSIYYYDEKSGTLANYTVKNRSVEIGDMGVSKYTIYTVKVSKGTSVDSKLRYKDGSSVTAYIPAFWVKPIDDIYINITRSSNDDNPTPPTDICTSSDPMKKYCCNYPTDPICKQLKEPETPDNKSGTCAVSQTVTKNFKYPRLGWGELQLNNPAFPKTANTACSVSCQETFAVTFQPRQSLKAGMGFDYPVNTYGTRICVAAYTNDTWKAKMDQAVALAKQYYDEMKSYLISANNKATACGSKNTITTYIEAEYKSKGHRSSGCSKCSHGCKSPTCKSCPSTHDYTDFSSYAMAPNSKIFDNIVADANATFNTNSRSILTSASYKTNNIYSFNNHNNSITSSGDCTLAVADNLLAANNTAPPCSCSDSDCGDKYCPGKTCHQYECSSSGDWWDSAQSGINSDLSRANTAKNNYLAQKAIIDQLNADRTTCDNWVKDNDYAPVTNDMTVSNLEYQSEYIDTDDSQRDINYKTLSSSYNISYCNYGKHGVSKSSYNKFSLGSFDRESYCLSTYFKATTLNNYWIKESIDDRDYEFSNDYYVRRYTGETTLDKNTAGYDHDGRYEYTDFFASTGDTDFTVRARNLGPNLPILPAGVSSSYWSVDPFDCRYHVENLIFPPDGDKNYPLYGNVAFMYRQVSLDDPFPNNRKPGENWNGRQSLITSKGYSIYDNTPYYEIILTPATMQNIRLGETIPLNYNSFNPNNPYVSEFVRNYIGNGIITKRVGD